MLKGTNILALLLLKLYIPLPKYEIMEVLKQSKRALALYIDERIAMNKASVGLVWRRGGHSQTEN